MTWEKNKLVILDEPYVSEETIAYLQNEDVKVLNNKMTEGYEKFPGLKLVNDEEFKDLYNQGGRIYTNSENALAWIVDNIKDEKLLDSINNVKNKAKFREVIKPMNPDFFFEEVSLKNIKDIDPKKLPLPVILKPSVGFFSVGVHSIESIEDWTNAVKEIKEQHQDWKNDYAESVVDDSNFIIEGYIEGEEYAVDVYFNEKGEAVILNILKHDFSGSKDVSDRLYYSSYEIIKKYLEKFTNYLNEMNKYLKAVDFPVHIEIRIQGDNIIPIECNPLRFAGWCTTDLSLFAYGFHTYDYYLNNKTPDWDSLLTGKEDNLYGMIILDKSGETKGKTFDYERLSKNFARVIKLRKLEDNRFPVFGFVFTETKVGMRKELDEIMIEDFNKYLTGNI